MTTPLIPGPLWRGLAILMALGLALNGAAMLLTAGQWYAVVPGVAQTGPLNSHFVNDIGAAFLAAALSFAFAAWQRERRLLLPGAAFLWLHAGLHLIDALSFGHAHGEILTVEITGIHLPALIAILLVIPAHWQTVLPIPAKLAESRIALRERMLGVPLTYMREMAQAKSPILLKLGKLAALHRSGHWEAPAEIRHFAALGATQQEDCGECLQIGVNLARAAGIDPALLQAVIDCRPDKLPSHLALAWRFGQSVAANAPEMEDARMVLERRYGRRAIMELSYDLAMARFYPTVKRALGYAQSCTAIRLQVA